MASKYLKIALEQAKKDSSEALIKRIKYDIDIITPINKNVSFVDRKVCGIKPLSIKTIKTPKFEKTYLATKEMEERIFYLHKIDNGDELLTIYIDNLGRDLYISDSLVANKLTDNNKKQFETFYNEKLTNLKDATNIYQKQLSTFYNKKKRQYIKELDQLKTTLAQKDQKELNRLNDLIAQNRKDFQKAIKPKVTPKTRLKNSIGNIVGKIPQPSVASIKSYPAQWTSFGWKNIDKYTHLLANGFETVEIATNENKGFSKVFQYLNTIKTVTPLMISNNIVNANFPKKGTSASREMKNTYCFNLSKKDGKYFWGKKQYNPYTQVEITVKTTETPLSIIRQELQLVGEDGSFAMDYFQKAIKQEAINNRKQAENKARLIEEQKKRDELFKAYEAKQAKLNAEIEQKRQEQLAENNFMETLRCIAFPCYENKTVADFSVIEEAREWGDSIIYSFATVEDKPEFPGGSPALSTYISDNVVYPQEAKDNSISGKVYVQFTIDKNGKVTDPLVIKSVSKLLDEEALKVIQNMPDWSAGLYRGKRVNVSYTIPINFKLKD